MNITCCLIAKDPLRTKERASWFMQALISTRPFSETIVCLQGECDQKIIRMLAPAAKIIKPAKPLIAEEAFNFAVKHAKHDWVTVGCDDDYYCADNVRVLEREVHPEEGAGVIYFPYYVIKPETKDFGVHWPPAPFTLEQLTEYNFVSTAAVVHKKVLLVTGGWRHGDAIAGDWDLWVRAKKRGFPFVYFPLPLYYQRYYSTSGFQKQLERVGKEAIDQHIKETARG